MFPIEEIIEHESGYVSYYEVIFVDGNGYRQTAFTTMYEGLVRGLVGIDKHNHRPVYQEEVQGSWPSARAARRDF